MMLLTAPKLELKAVLRFASLVLIALTVSLPFSETLAQKASATKTATTSRTGRSVRQYTIEQFMDTVRIFGSSFSADEKEVLFSSNKTGIFNVYTVPTMGGDPKPLTNSTK